jgi:hypothetical protein
MDKSAFIVSEGAAVFMWVIKLNYRGVAFLLTALNPIAQVRPVID